MKSLYVFYENQRVGVFSRDENLVSSFSYDEQWQVGNNSFPLSFAMPLSEKTFNNRVTLSFFINGQRASSTRCMKNYERTKMIAFDSVDSACYHLSRLIIFAGDHSWQA